MIDAPHLKKDTSYYIVLKDVSVSEILIRYLLMEGIDTVFGLAGKGVNELVRDLAFSEYGGLRPEFNGLKYIQSRHDGGGGFMADGYGRVSGKIGVCVVTSGPGGTNALTAAAVAQSDSAAVLFISGEVAEADFGKGGFQEGADSGIDTVAIFSGATDYSVQVTNKDNFQTLFSQALRTSTVVPRRATHVSLPMDIAKERFAEALVPRHRHNYISEAKSGSPSQTKEAFDILHAAKSPLLFLGSGCRYAFYDTRDPERAAQRLADFTTFVVDKHALPVITTPRAKGIFPETSPLSLRNYGLSACTWPEYYFRQAEWADRPPYDALLVLGTSLKQWSVADFDHILVPCGPLIQANIDPTVIARVFPVEFGIVADVQHVIDELIALGRERNPAPDAEARRRFITETLKGNVSPWVDPEKRTSDAIPLKPQRLMADIQKTLDEAAAGRSPAINLFIDIGNNAGFSWHELTIDPPNAIWSNTGMGSMGWANGAVVGGKLAAPAKAAVCITGDGGFFMNGAEVMTAFQHKIGCVWIVLREDEYNMVAQGFQGDYPEPPPGTTWDAYFSQGDARVETMAMGYGAEVHTVTKPGEMVEVLPKALAAAAADKRPHVIVAYIDPAEKPPYPVPAWPNSIVEAVDSGAGALQRARIPGWRLERRMSLADVNQHSDIVRNARAALDRIKRKP